MEKLSKLPLVILASIFLGCFANSQTTKVVTDCNMQGWSIDNNSLSQITFAQPATVATTGANGLEFRATGETPIRVRLGAYNNTLLKDITELKYSTSTKDDNKVTAFVALHVAFTRLVVTSDSRLKDSVILVFEPRYQDGTYEGSGQFIDTYTPQGPVQKNQWQEWDGLKGIWWLNYNNKIDPLTIPDAAPFYKLCTFREKYPDAKLVLLAEFRW